MNKSILVFWMLGLLTLGEASAVVIDPALSRGRAESGTWIECADEGNLIATAPILRGEEGVWLLSETPHAEFSWTVRMRFDVLHAAVDTPASGIVLNYHDTRNYDRVVLEPRSGRLIYQRLKNGRSSLIAATEIPFQPAMGDWFSLRVIQSEQGLEAGVSPDGLDWSITLHVPNEKQVRATSSVKTGLIAGSPATLFADVNARELNDARLVELRYRGEFVQTSATARQSSVTALVEVTDPAKKVALVFSVEGQRKSYPVVANRAGIVRVPLQHETATGAEPASLELLIEDKSVAERPFVWPLVPTTSASNTEEIIPTNPGRLKRTDYRAAAQRVDAFWKSGGAGRNEFAVHGNLALYRSKPTPELRASIQREARKLVDDFETKRLVPRSFSTLLPSMQVLRIARDENLLPAAALERIPALAAAALEQSDYERGAMNRALGLAAGIEPALALARDFPRAAEVRRVRELVEQDLAKNDFEPLEDSTNYQLLSLFFIMEWARTTERPELISHPGFRARFERLLLQISPIGTLPAYGDDIHGQPGMLIGLFEQAARLWQDGRYRWAAERIFWRHFGAGLPAGLLGQDYYGLALAATVADESLVPIEPAARSQLLKRNDGTPDKLVLRGGNQAQDMYVLLDLVNGYEHGHADALAVVGMTGAEKILLDGAGRYTRGVTFKNMLQVISHPEDFPLRREVAEQTRRMRDPLVKLGEWQKFHLPLRRNWIWGNFANDIGLPRLNPDNYHPDIDSKYAYDPQRQGAVLLEVKGRGKVRLETREMRFTKGTTNAPIHFPASAEINLGVDTSYVGVVLDRPLDLKSGEYDWLEFEARLQLVAGAGNEAYVQSVVLGDRDGYPKRFLEANGTAGDVVVRHFSQESWGTVAELEMKTSTPQGNPVTMMRKVALLNNRLLWVRDVIAIGAGNSFTAGPTWHLATATMNPGNVVATLSGLNLAFAKQPGAGPATLRKHTVYGVSSPYIYSLASVVTEASPGTYDSFLWIDGDHPQPVWRNQADGSVELEIDAQHFVAPADTSEGAAWVKSRP